MAAPAKRKWTILYYLVAEPYASSDTDIPPALDSPLNDVAEAEIKAIKEAAATAADAYVAYQVVSPSKAIRGVVGVVPEAPAPPPSGNPDELVMFWDLFGFLNWAMPQCPADHYAVFFWGHSLGPAGMFDLADANTPVTMIHVSEQNPLFIRAQRGEDARALAPDWNRVFTLLRPSRAQLLARLRRSGGTMRDRAIAAIDHESLIRSLDNLGHGLRIMYNMITVHNTVNALGTIFLDPTAAPHRIRPEGYLGDIPAVNQKCDLMVFKNCYMSALEAAVEMRSVAQYVIASQSQVPIWKYSALGVKKPGVWPHDELMQCFGDDVKVTSEAVHQTLADFYAVERNCATLEEVPYTLLDLGEADAIKTRFGTLVEKLMKLSKLDRGKLMAGAATGPLDQKPGNVALIDLKRLCIEVLTTTIANGGANWQAAQYQAALLLQELKLFVLGHAPAGNVCYGVSHFYYPTATSKQLAAAADDFNLHAKTTSLNYNSLEVGQLDVGGGLVQLAWSEVAFEQR